MGVQYGPGFAIGNPVQTQQDNIGDTDWAAPISDYDITRYVDQNIGGETGTVIRNGYTTGLNRDWWASPFAGGHARFVRRDLAKDTGPVGRDNSRTVLEAGVKQQYTTYPSIEDIYKSFVRG